MSQSQQRLTCGESILAKPTQPHSALQVPVNTTSCHFVKVADHVAFSEGKGPRVTYSD